MPNDIPPEAAALVMACLAKEPGQRPPSARAVAEWIGLAVEATPSAESLAAALFPQEQSSPVPVAGEPAEDSPSTPAGYGGPPMLPGMLVAGKVSKGAGYGWKLAAVGIVVLVLAAAFWLRKDILRRDHSNASVAAKAPAPTAEAGPEQIPSTATPAPSATPGPSSAAEAQPPSQETAPMSAATADWRRGLVLYFSFDEPPKNGVVVDQSGQHNDGQAVGVKWVPNGHRGGGAEFGPGESHIRVPNNDGLNSPQFTLAVWIKTTRKDASFRRIFEKGTYDKTWTHQVGYDLTMGGTDKGKSYQGHVLVELAMRAAGTQHLTTDGGWHHVAGTYDGSNLLIYLDGYLDGMDHVTTPLGPTSYDLAIGNMCTVRSDVLDKTGFIGMMDDVMVFNRALAPDEVRQLYELPSAPEGAINPVPAPAPSATAAAQPPPQGPGTNSAALNQPGWISSQVPKPGADGWIVLFDGKRLCGCTPSAADLDSGKVSLQNDGTLRLDSALLGFNLSCTNVVISARVRKMSGQNCFIAVRSDKRSGQELRDCLAWFNGGNSFGIGKTGEGEFKNLVSNRSQDRYDGFFQMEFRAEGKNLTLKANDRTICEAADTSIIKGQFVVVALNGVSLFESIKARVLDQH
jgi:hypothetical protein